MNRTATMRADVTPDLSCMLIPLQGAPLLLPSACVAEILPWRRITPVEGAPEWCLGQLGWRGETIPVVRFERINQPRVDCPAAGRCLVVMNRTAAAPRSAPFGKPFGAPFYAIAAEGLPRMVQLTDGDLAEGNLSEAEARLGRAEYVVVRVGTELASIPNLGAIEQQVDALSR